MQIESEYLKVVLTRFESVKNLGTNTMKQLNENEIHWKPNHVSNSIGMIVKHLSGNMISRWTDFLTTDGEKSYRNRDNEFLDTKIKFEDVMLLWEKGWDVLFTTLKTISSDDLLKTIYIRGEGQSVISAIERQLSHYSYHVGQIVYIGKLLREGEWKNLSIPLFESEKYLQDTVAKHNVNFE